MELRSEMKGNETGKKLIRPDRPEGRVEDGRDGGGREVTGTISIPSSANLYSNEIWATDAIEIYFEEFLSVTLGRK